MNDLGLSQAFAHFSPGTKKAVESRTSTYSAIAAFWTTILQGDPKVVVL